MEDKKVTVFVGEHCKPCAEVKELLQEGAFLVNDEEGHSVDLVDVETQEGFISMVKHGAVDGIPKAFIGDKICNISIDREEGIVLLECPNDEGSD